MTACLMSLFSCSGTAGVPEGMQLVRGSESLGYYFYAPEEWTVANIGEVASAYASSVDSSNVSYVEIDPIDTTVKEYFEKSLLEFTLEVEVVNQDGEAVIFGNADNARAFVFDYTYAEHKFRTMQIFAEFENRFGIFTFTSFRENMSSSEKTQYEYYLEKVKSITDNFKFVSKTKGEDAPTFEKGEDGYYLVSDHKTAGFSLYLPDGFEVDYSSGIVTAHTEDGSSLTLSRATSTGVDITTYWNMRKAELEALFGNITVILKDGQEKELYEATLGDSNRAAAVEYTYEYAGKTYHVYQIFGVTTWNGYVFTFTATEDNYQSHIDAIKAIAGKVKF